MRIVGWIATLFVVTLFGVGGWFVYKTLFKPPDQIFFKTQKLEKRDISRIVNAEGSLEAQGTLKIGSLISAKVKKIHVKEGNKVSKDTLLADLENDQGGDAQVRQTQAALKKAQADLEYQTAYYKREKELFSSGQIAKETFENDTKNYLNAQAEVDRSQAAYDKEVFLFQQTQVRAPIDGIIVSIPVKEGQAFSPSNATSAVIVEMARDLGTMKTTLAIDENKIGDISVGMEAKITVDAYPDHKPWRGKIISLATGRTGASSGSQNQQQGQSVSYEAEVLIDNAQNLLRPGMTVHAKITVEKVKQVPAIPGFVFQLNPKVLETAAKKMHFEYKPLEHGKKKELEKQQEGKHPVKTLWVVAGKSFIEKPVAIGVTDNAYFQILSGISEADDIIADDMTASEEMKKIAQQVAGS